MGLIELKDALRALEKADIINEGKKVNRAPFREYIEGLSYYQKLSEERKQEISNEVDIWYSQDAVAERTISYLEKVFADKASPATDLVDARHIANEVCIGFSKVFGLKSMYDLPVFQLELLKMMCSIHLGVHSSSPIVLENGRPFNSNKGIFVAGKPQIGKTSVFVYLKSTPYFSYRIITGTKLMELCATHKMQAVEEYGTRGKVLVIDEIGWENVAANYANKIDAVAEVIHRRDARGLMTHITSNHTIEALRERYQPHIIARIEKNCNILEVRGADAFF